MTDVSRHYCLGRRCIEKQNTNLKLRKLKHSALHQGEGQRQQENIKPTFVQYSIHVQYIQYTCTAVGSKEHVGTIRSSRSSLADDREYILLLSTMVGHMYYKVHCEG